MYHLQIGWSEMLTALSKTGKLKNEISAPETLGYLLVNVA